MSREGPITWLVEKVASFLLGAPSAWLPPLLSTQHPSFNSRKKAVVPALGGVGMDSNPGQERVSLGSVL